MHTERRLPMYRVSFSLLFGLIFSMFVIGSAFGGGDLATYEPKSPAEAEIKKTLMNLQETNNKSDIDGCLCLYHENARVQTNSRGSMSAKKDLPKYYKKVWGTHPRVQFGSPEIAVDGERAVVKMKAESTKSCGAIESTANTYTMVREGGTWLIVKQNYSGGAKGAQGMAGEG
jgi:hypothetical protein